MQSGRMLLFIWILTFMVNDIICSSGPKSDSIKYPYYKRLKEEFPESSADKFDLLMVGTYIAAHKYFGVDWRYQTGHVQEEDQKFYKEFPKPPLKPNEFHPQAKERCEKGTEDCLKDVANVAERSGNLQFIYKAYWRAYDPFQSNFEMFLYRQTAMYYLCWYTKRRNDLLRYPGNGLPCLSLLWATGDVPEETRRHLYEESLPAIVDVREKDMKSDPFICAELWFCPDPCYGRETKGNYKSNNPNDKHPGNPCNDLDDTSCYVKTEDNKNFDSLMKNMFNVSCACENQRKGFVWDEKFGLCVDLDECEKKIGHCPGNKVCRNTVGSYICACPKGYLENTNNKKCVRIVTFQNKGKGSEYKASGDEEEDNGDILTDLMEFAGLSCGCKYTLSVSLAAAVLLSVCLLLLL